MDDCSIGIALKEVCHKETYSRKKELILLNSLDEEERELLLWRTNVDDFGEDESAAVCLHHYKKYVIKFEKKKCCNIFQAHSGKKAVKAIHKITLKTAKILKEKNYDVIPGWSFCPTCNKTRIAIEKKPMDSAKTDSEDDSSICSFASSCGETSEIATAKSLIKHKINYTLTSAGISPVSSSHALPKKLRKIQAEKKIKSVARELQSSYTDLIGVGVEDILKPPIIDKNELKQLRRKAADHDHLNLEIKEKLSEVTGSKEKQQLLTLKPVSWSVLEAAKFFNVSQYTVRSANELKNNNGLLAMPERKKRTGTSEEIKQMVMAFYQDDEFSRMMPGKKDCVSMGNNEYKQKRLLLCNISELFAAFHERNEGSKIGITKFFSLRPKWCVGVSSSGSHSVCVCAHHQNAILLANAVNTGDDYKSLMEKLVCDVSNPICMLRRCEDCPGEQGLKEYLTLSIPFEEDEEVRFQQWQTTDRCNINTLLLPCSDFIEKVVVAMDDLTSHSYIAKCQGRYLKHQKENLSRSSVIVLLDFAENYQFVVQDEIQGFHWNQSQCTLHPAVIYFVDDEGKLDNLSLCCISDDLNHDTVFVHNLISEVSKTIKTKFGERIQLIQYFSDGCAGQYKNYKNMLNLCFHKADFHIDATWSFFATSHGKSPCDGIGGTVKRLVARSSLQRPIGDQILTADAMYTYCSTNISGIEFVFLKQETLESSRTRLHSRYNLGSTIKGTRSYHHFVPISNNVVGFKRTSEDAEFSGQHRFSLVSSDVTNSIRPNIYIACRFYSKWWIALVDDINEEENDLHVIFMHPPASNSDFYWPSTRTDQCWIQMQEVICEVSTPLATTASGRTYKISDDDRENILRKFNKPSVN